MKIDLPLENWVDLFGSVPRVQLVELLPQINDRQFGKFLQFFLNKCGEITLGCLYIWKNEEGSIIASSNSRKLPIADLPMPANINNFKLLSISNCDFDSPTMTFLHQFQINSLLVNVNLEFHHCTADDVYAFLTKVLPMITSINSITARETRINNLLDLLENKFPSLSKRMLTSARVLNTWHSLSIDWICRWLYTPREDGKPGVLYHFYAPNNDNSLVNRVKKDFMEAKEAISFFLRFHPFDFNVEPLTLENVQTHETLVISICVYGFQYVKISRYPIGANEEWIKEMSKYEHWKCRNIYMYGNDLQYQWSSCSSESEFRCDSLDEIEAGMKKSRGKKTINKGMKKAMAKKGKKSRKKRKQSRIRAVPHVRCAVCVCGMCVGFCACVVRVRVL